MSAIITILDEPSEDVSTSSFVFDVIWFLLQARVTHEPYRLDAEYLTAISWRETSYDCFLDLRKSQRPTLQAIRALMLEHADAGHPHWKDYYSKYLATEAEQNLRLWQCWTQKAMLETAKAIERRIEIEDIPVTAAQRVKSSPS